jgi:hypothetical protein
VLDTLSRLTIVDDEKKSVKLYKDRELDTLFAGNVSLDEFIRGEFYIDFNENYIFTATLIKIKLAFKK